MDKYLKMAGVFVHDSVEELEQHIYAGYMSKYCSEYAAHAINSHDELVQMNEDLLAALEQCAKELAWMIDRHNEQNMEDGSWKYDHQTPWEAMQLVVKAKGGAV